MQPKIKNRGGSGGLVTHPDARGPLFEGVRGRLQIFLRSVLRAY